MFALYLLILLQPLGILPSLFMSLGTDYSACHVQSYLTAINYLQVIFGRNCTASSISVLRCLLQHILKQMDPLNDQIRRQLKLYGVMSTDDRQIGWII